MAASGHSIEAGCWHHTPDQDWVEDPDASWSAPGFAQTDAHPVTCIRHADALAYTRWLSEQTGQRYRLPSEAEFEYFHRAGRDGDHILGSGAALCARANGADAGSGMPYAYACNDNYTHTAPVRSFPANAFGLHDTAGNLWEYTADCWNDDHGGNWRTFFLGAPTDGSARRRGQCGLRVIRGGSYLSSADNLRAFRREPGAGKLRLSRNGLRVVREL